MFTLYRMALRRRENNTGWGFCSHIRTVILAPFLCRIEAAPRRSRKWSATYRIGSVTHIGVM